MGGEGEGRIPGMRARAILLVVLLAAGVLAAGPAAEEYTWWVETCATETAQATGCAAGDEELAGWALAAWQRESGGAVAFRRSASEAGARIRIRWAGGGRNLYGETRAIEAGGKRGAEIYVLPEVRALSPEIAAAAGGDVLLRDAIVYLTCLHESGHALGLAHTREFTDIMYSFGYGGDVVAYFGRYRRLLRTRADIAVHSGVSENDRAALRRLLVK